MDFELNIFYIVTLKHIFQLAWLYNILYLNFISFII